MAHSPNDPGRGSNGPNSTGNNGGDGLELTGVRSNNPFADDNGPQQHNSHQEESVDPVVGGTGYQSESVRSSAISPGPGEDVFHEVNPLEYAQGQSDEQTLEQRNTHDHAERGTDIFANADPPTSADSDDYDDKSRPVSPNHSEKDGDSISKPSPARIRFGGATATSTSMDRAPTLEEENKPHEEADGIMDKIKSLGHDAKSKLHISGAKATTPIQGFNPTNVRMRVNFSDDPKDKSKDVGIIWRSRDNRKGRNSISMPRASMAYPNLPPKNRPVYSSSFKGVRQNLWRMAFTFPYWDMAFWSGWSYTWGSVLFVMDGVWAWGPVGWNVKWEVEQNYIIGIFFFVGALLYQLGATMAYLESVNDGSFHGSAMKRFLEGHQDEQKRMLDEKMHRVFGHLNPMHEKRRHQAEHEETKRMEGVDPESGWRSINRTERPGSIYPGGKTPAPRRGGVDLGETEEGESHEYLTWRWYPTWHALKTHHIYEIGYIACSIQLFGATLYSWCGLVSVPHLNDNWTDADFYGGYWFPELCGSCCFLVASIMFLMETQEKWYKPEFKVMGWWIGFWAKIGSWGFLLNGVFGIIAQAQPHWDWAEFASECCTTWGSFGYLCSSLCQWYEAVNKHPVEEMIDDGSDDLESYQVHSV